jgi:site-specific DNA-adenine methylase
MKVSKLFRYTGSKAKILKSYYPYFRNLRPQYTVDYFAGSGSVSTWFHLLYPQAKKYLNEIDTATCKIFLSIRDDHEEFCRFLEYHERTNMAWHGFEAKKQLFNFIKAEYNSQYQGWIDYDLDPGGFDEVTEEEWQEMTGFGTSFEHTMYFFLRAHSFSGVNRRNRRGEYASTPGIRGPNARTYKPEALKAFKAMIDHAEVLNKDYREVQLELPRSLHYLDPPYLGTGPGLYPTVKNFDWKETERVCVFAYDLSKRHTVFLSNEDDAKLIDHMKSMGFEYARIPRSGTGKMAATKKSAKDYEALFYKIQPDILPQ